MSTAFVIGNGESRLIYPIDTLKNQGFVYGCNAIFRTNPSLCDAIVTVNPNIHKEILLAQQENKIEKKTKIIGLKEIPKWDYILPKDREDYCPPGLDFYRFWIGGDIWTNAVRRRDLSTAKGSGCSAVLHAAELNFRNILIIGFDILGAKQWEIKSKELSREQNNVYKDSPEYPGRDSMKAYLKHEWLYQLTQIFKKYRDTNFYYINRQEYIEGNPLLPKYFSQAPGNVRAGVYANLKKYVDKVDNISWYIFKKGKLIKN